MESASPVWLTDWFIELVEREAARSLFFPPEAWQKARAAPDDSVCVPRAPTLVFVVILMPLHASPSRRTGACVCLCVHLPARWHKKRWGVRVINLHLVIYEGFRLSGIQRCLVQLILLCWRGEPRGICASCHLPSLPIALSYSACCRQQPRGIAERARRKTEWERKPGGINPVATHGRCWGSHAYSLIKESERGQRGNKHDAQTGECVNCNLWTQTHTSIKPPCPGSKTGNYGADTFFLCPLLAPSTCLLSLPGHTASCRHPRGSLSGLILGLARSDWQAC